MDKVSEQRLMEVHPKLADKIHEMAATLALESIEIRVTQGFRTWGEQHALYLQGRALLPDVNACRKNCGMFPLPPEQNRKVTNADSGRSWHNYKLAVDVAPFNNGFPIWDESNPAWARIVDVGVSLGLRNGLSWHDEPHFEMTGKLGPDPGWEVISLYKEANVDGSGITAVWNVAGLSI